MQMKIFVKLVISNCDILDRNLNSLLECKSLTANVLACLLLSNCSRISNKYIVYCLSPSTIIM